MPFESDRPSGAPAVREFPRVRAVFFDLAGTLIHVKGGIGAQYAAIAREFGVRADAKAIDAAFPRAFAAAGRMVPARPDAAEVASLERGFWKEVVRVVFEEIDAADRFAGNLFDAYFDRLFEYFATAAGWAIYPDVVPALRRLKDEGAILGLITNFDQRVFRLVEALGLGRWFDSITIPAVAGAAKPDAAIFEHALRRHGLHAPEAMQVGDSIEDDVAGARAAGMPGVLLDRKGRCRENATAPVLERAATTAPPVVCISSLAELHTVPPLRP